MLTGARAPARNLVAVAHHQREMAVAGHQPGLRTGNMSHQPTPVREGNHLVELPLPNGDGRVDVAQVEAPVARERQVVVDPSVEAWCERAAEHRGQRVGVAAIQHGAVDRGREAAERIREARPGHVAQVFAVLAHPLPQHRLSFARGAELVHVLLPHSGEKVEVGAAVGADACQRRCGPAAAGQPGCATRDAGRRPTIPRDEGPGPALRTAAVSSAACATVRPALRVEPAYPGRRACRPATGQAPDGPRASRRGRGIARVPWCATSANSARVAAGVRPRLCGRRGRDVAQVDGQRCGGRGRSGRLPAGRRGHARGQQRG